MSGNQSGNNGGGGSNPFSTIQTLLRSIATACNGLITAITSAAPITTSQPASMFLASPSNSAGTPGFRSLLSSDVNGLTNGSSAAPGIVGEYFFASVASGSAVNLTTVVTANLTSFTLSPGDWDVWGGIGISCSGTTIQVVGSIAATPTGLGNIGLGNSIFLWSGSASSVGFQTPLSMSRQNITTATTFYLNAQTNFSTGTSTAYGFMAARRVR